MLKNKNNATYRQLNIFIILFSIGNLFYKKIDISLHRSFLRNKFPQDYFLGLRILI